MSYKVAVKTMVISTDDTKKMDLFEKGRLVQGFLSDILPFGYLMTSVTNNSKDYLMSVDDVKLFIDDTVKDVTGLLTTTLDENYKFGSYSIDSVSVDKKRVAVSVAVVTIPVEEASASSETEELATV